VTFEYEAPTSAQPSTAASQRTTLDGGTPSLAKAGGGGDSPSFRLFVGPDAKLPVEWAGFDATTQKQAVTLTWQTASETDNAGFAVQRRVDGSGGTGAWTRVGFVEGSGTTTRPRATASPTTAFRLRPNA